MDEVTVGGDAADAAASLVGDSRRLLDATRRGEGVDKALAALANYSDDDLNPLREDRSTALAFWLNCYNAGTQLLLDRRPDLYESPLRTIRFFRADALSVSGTALSLDDIEHGILRGSRSKYGLGYLPRLADGPFIDRHRVELDPRIHFALNCGAASCPAIRYYEPTAVDEQLDLAAETYLHGTVEYDSDANIARVPRVFLWYRGDFSDPVELLHRYGVVPEDTDPSLRYRSWDWSQAPKKFVDE